MPLAANVTRNPEKNLFNSAGWRGPDPKNMKKHWQSNEKKFSGGRNQIARQVVEPQLNLQCPD
jgi:hypothetical protein